MSETKNILLTNDDGINSVGIWAAAEALAPLGKVWVVAPRTQATSFGRSNPSSSDGIIEVIQREVNGVTWQGYAAGASPSQCVLYSVEELLPVKPDLVVSGINYGANTSVDITRSGTIGAALEGANYGIPALAVSFETAAENTFLHTFEADFSTAAHFTALFARALLEKKFPADVIKQGGRRFARRAPAQVPGIIFNAGAIPRGLQHFHVIHRAHFKALGLQQFFVCFQDADLFLKFGRDARHGGRHGIRGLDKMLGG